MTAKQWVLYQIENGFLENLLQPKDFLDYAECNQCYLGMYPQYQWHLEMSCDCGLRSLERKFIHDIMLSSAVSCRFLNLDAIGKISKFSDLDMLIIIFLLVSLHLKVIVSEINVLRRTPNFWFATRHRWLTLYHSRCPLYKLLPSSLGLHQWWDLRIPPEITSRMKLTSRHFLTFISRMHYLSQPTWIFSFF